MLRKNVLLFVFGFLFYFLGFLVSSTNPVNAQIFIFQQYSKQETHECSCWCGASMRIICEVSFCGPGLIPNCKTMFRDDCSDSGFGGPCEDFITWCDALCEPR